MEGSDLPVNGSLHPSTGIDGSRDSTVRSPLDADRTFEN